MKKALFLALLSLLACSVPFAQEKPLSTINREVPPAPVVSGLSAISEGNNVTLTWIKAPGIEGDSVIFRATKPITGATFNIAEKRGTVPFETTTFQDTIGYDQDYYYAVLSTDANGKLYEFFIPVNNSLLIAVSAVSKSQPIGTSAISAFDTIMRNDAVIITWKASVPDSTLVLYRSTSPFTNMNSLVQAVVVSSFTDTGTPYVDYPVPGVPYYYSLLDENTIRSGTVRFTENENTNRIPVEIPASFARVQRNKLPALRPMPLPFLNISSTTTPPALSFSTETEKMIKILSRVNNSKKESNRDAYVFTSDIQSVSGGEEYNLKKILEASFATHLWPEAITSLTQFLSIRRTEETTARAHFYLGEAYFFTGNYRASLLEFLLSQDLYQNQSREWIQYVLEKMI